MPNEEILKKITGDFPDEVGEALYRTAASIFVNTVIVQGIDRLEDNNALKAVLNKNKQITEAGISFVLAVVLELVPMPRLGDDARKRLAYNLRVRSYEKIPELGIRLTPAISLMQDWAERALELAKRGPSEKAAEDTTPLVKGDLKTGQPASDASKVTAADDSHEGAAAAVTPEPKAIRSTRARRA